MILSIVVTLYVSIFMYRAAISAGRRGWLWSLATISWISLLQLLFGLSVFIVIIGFLSLFFPIIFTQPQLPARKPKQSNTNHHSLT